MERAKKYYHHVLDFQLYGSAAAWEEIRRLEILRHTLIHAGGRVDRAKQSVRDRLEDWARQDIGILTHYDDLTVSKDYLAQVSEAVISELEGLVERFHQLDDQHSA